MRPDSIQHLERQVLWFEEREHADAVGGMEPISADVGGESIFTGVSERGVSDVVTETDSFS